MDYQKLIPILKSYYPAEWISEETIESDVLTDKMIVEPDLFLPYLQTALLDEKFVEVRLDDDELPHFTKIIDWPQKDGGSCPLEGNEESSVSSASPAAYLKDLSHLTTLPLEPGIGNFNIRNSSRALMRFFTKSFAVDLCTRYLARDKDVNIPVIHFHYPLVVRLLYGVREYRAKVIRDLDLHVEVTGKRKQPDMLRSAVNISVGGLAFSLQKDDLPHIFINESRKLRLILKNNVDIAIDGKVRHVTRIRKRTRIAYLCGVQFELSTRTVAREVEALVALVQRAHLQALSGIAQETGYNLIS